MGRRKVEWRRKVGMTWTEKSTKKEMKAGSGGNITPLLPTARVKGTGKWLGKGAYSTTPVTQPMGERKAALVRGWCR